MLKIKMYPAKNGDSFLVDAGGTFILIDAGFASTFQDFGPSEPRRSVIYIFQIGMAVMALSVAAGV